MPKISKEYLEFNQEIEKVSQKTIDAETGQSVVAHFEKNGNLKNKNK